MRLVEDHAFERDLCKPPGGLRAPGDEPGRDDPDAGRAGADGLGPGGGMFDAVMIHPLSAVPDGQSDKVELGLVQARDEDMKDIIKRIPILGDLARRIYCRLLGSSRNPEPFPGSVAYWENRYSAGGNSGVGSYDLFAKFKADGSTDSSPHIMYRP